ncbi:G protein-coupled glucose receptor regulating Gpa2-domain-containing protein [Thermothelomyces heterothallicus CBS 202.75]|uniref:G protein-coupled glucose receptor regulating Gpa2-domain-containing protein n=1 Tax=Thermothelomyces heterothallicus CBS 202.75 TaxID=1149848 RepID=UPI0037443F1E
MTVPRWMSLGMGLRYLLDGTTSFETLSVVTRHHARTDGESRMIRTLLILSLTFASISVMSTLFALYWFVRMRRGFRHELILLLIKGDFVKSTVLLVYAIVSFARGNVRPSSAFCQVSGFALAVGVEASDVAVLLIALHSAMYILRPRSGLYPYRHFAYLAFYLFPIVAACLTFIAGNGYGDMGPYCYIRTDQRWARLALSWAPRYAICAAIVLIYLFIYFYIRRRMGDFGRRHSEATQPRFPSESAGAISMPRFRYNGLLPSSSSSRPTSTTDTISAVKDQLRSPSSIGPTLSVSASARTSAEAPRRRPVKWNWTVFAYDQLPGSSRPSADDTYDLTSPSSPGHLLIPPSPAYSNRRNTVPSDHVLSGSYPGGSSSSSSSSNNNNSNSSSRRISLPPSLPQHTDDGRAEVDVDTSDSSPMLPVPAASLPPPPSSSHFTASITPADRDPDPDPAPDPIPSKQLNNKRTVRQLRALFVYPLAYIVVWLFPFVSHVMGYDDDSIRYRGQGTPHWLFVVSTISLGVQGAVDCTLFLLRETPWRHVSAGAKGGFWAALGRRWSWNLRRVTWWCGRGWGWKGSSADGVGRTREEMLVDGRLARERREEEVAVERERRRRRRTRRREWWDVYVERDGILDGNDGLDDVDDGEGQVEVPQEIG